MATLFGVGCCLITKSCSALLQPHGLQRVRLLCPWNSPGKNTGVGCYFFLQGIFPTQESNPCLLHWQTGSLPLSPQGSFLLKVSQSKSGSQWMIVQMNEAIKLWTHCFSPHANRTWCFLYFQDSASDSGMHVRITWKFTFRKTLLPGSLSGGFSLIDPRHSLGVKSFKISPDDSDL